MSLPVSTTNITQTLPSYLYFQYQNDQDLPSLINAYNTLTQEYVDWFNDINLPVYTGLSGALLDWVGQGLYGLQRPAIAKASYLYVKGATDSYATLGLPTDAAEEMGAVVLPNIPDDIYKRMLTWWFFKGDGFDFSIPWLKRRIYRFLYGANGTNPMPSFTPTISVTFNESTTPIPTCAIEITDTVDNSTVSTYFKAFVDSELLCLPFRFQYDVTLYP